MSADREYFSCAETAKLVRVALKKAFPGVKFSVRSSVYSGGASMYVKWTDGPAEKAVKRVVSPYEGGGFDGMIDMAYSTESWLMPDGSAFCASSPGTEGSRGSVPGYEFEKPAPGARKVRFGAKFIFCDKDYSVETYTAIVAKVCADYGVAMPEIKVSSYDGSPSIDYQIKVENAGDYLSNLVGREMMKEGAKS